MAQDSSIEWTDATWNPVRGCSRVSEGCRHCYAERVAARFRGKGQPYEGLAHHVGGEARWTGLVRMASDDVVQQPMRWKMPRRIFVNSMSDLFHENLPDFAIDTVFAVMALCPQHTFQVLTKRSERMRRYFAPIGGVTRADFIFSAMGRLLNKNTLPFPQWPLPNVWLGVSVEDQERANERIPDLLATPAAVRFLSCEPLLGPLDLTAIRRKSAEGFCRPLDGRFNRIDWVICGGESGLGARPMHPDWARSLRDQCQRAAVPFFFKQWGEYADVDGPKVASSAGISQHQPGDFYFAPDGTRPKGLIGTSPYANHIMRRVGKKAAGRSLDGREWSEFPQVAA